MSGTDSTLEREPVMGTWTSYTTIKSQTNAGPIAWKNRVMSFKVTWQDLDCPQ